MEAWDGRSSGVTVIKMKATKSECDIMVIYAVQCIDFMTAWYVLVLVFVFCISATEEQKNMYLADIHKTSQDTLNARKYVAIFGSHLSRTETIFKWNFSNSKPLIQFPSGPRSSAARM